MVSEYDHVPAEQQDDEVSSVHSTSSQGRGRPRVIEAWTRVISMEHDVLSGLHRFPLNTDLMMTKNLQRNILNAEDHVWHMFFLSKDFVRENMGIATDNFALDDEALLLSGKQVSDLRKLFRERAE